MGRLVRRLAAVAAVVVAAAALLVGCQSGRARPASPTRPPGVDFRATTLAPHVGVYAWYDPGRTHAPWVVFIHGGAWLSSGGATPQIAAWARHEASRGFQVFSLDYRLSQVAPWPAQRDDVRTGVDWIRAHAGRFGLDRHRAVVMGESAGGELAAIEASRGGYIGAVDLAGAVDPLAFVNAPDRVLARATLQFVGCPPTTCPARWQDTRAAVHIDSQTPPFLILHSAGDPIVPTAESRAFASQLRAAHKQVTLRIVPGASHRLLGKPQVEPQIDAFLTHVSREAR